MLPIKDTMPLLRLPVVTLALIAGMAAAYFLVDEGGLLYVAACLYLLWLFGPPVEDTLGRMRFLAFCLGGALLAGLAQLAVDSDDVAASAAAGPLAAVLGGYLILFPRGTISTYVLVPFLWRVVELPAVVLLAAGAVLVVLAGPGVAPLAGIAFGLALGRALVDSARDRRGMPPRIPAY